MVIGGMRIIFNEFIRDLHRYGFYIVAMNEYMQYDLRHIYLVIMRKSVAYKTEGEYDDDRHGYGYLFDELIEKISFERN